MFPRAFLSSFCRLRCGNSRKDEKAEKCGQVFGENDPGVERVKGDVENEASAPYAAWRGGGGGQRTDPVCLVKTHDQDFC